MNWQTKRILVTGGAGFLGSSVVKELESVGCRHVIVARSKQWNLTDRDAIAHLYAQTSPDIVIHLAAVVGGIGFNLNNPGRLFYENALMGIETMEQARQFGVEKFVSVGTVCAYPKFAPIPFAESSLWNGYPEETNAPYGLAKKMQLVQGQAYRQQYGFNSIHLLPVNLYGPGDNFDLENSHIIPALIRKCVEAKKLGSAEVVLWGNGKATREFLYVDDAAKAIVLATEKYNGAEPVNLGTGVEISIHDLTHLVCELIGYRGKIVWDQSKPNGQPRRCLDTSKAKALFDFQATTDFRKGLQHTISWYCHHQETLSVSSDASEITTPLGK